MGAVALIKPSSHDCSDKHNASSNEINGTKA